MQNPSVSLESKVNTRCVFFRHSNSTIVEQQVNYFLTFAPLAKLHRSETNIINGDILITLWFDPCAQADNIDKIYADALDIAKF